MQQPEAARERGAPGFGRDVAVFGVSTVVAQLVSALTTPLYSRVLGPTQFGALEIVQATLSLAVTALLLGMDQAIVRAVSTRGRAAETFGVAARAPLAVTAVVVAGAVAIPDSLSRGLFGVASQQGLVRLSAIGLPALILAQLSQEALRAESAERPYLKSVACRSLLPAVIAPTLILATSLRASGVVLGTVAGAALAATLNVTALRGWLVRNPPGAREDRRELLAYGLPLLPAAVAGWSIMLIDRIVLAHNAPLAAVGTYSMSNRVAGLLLMVVYAFTVTWTAPAMRVASRSAIDGGRFRDLGVAVTWPLLSFVAIGVGAAAPEIVRIVGGSSYRGAAALVPLLAGGIVQLGEIALLQTQLLTEGRSKVVAGMAAAAAVINLAMTIPLVQWKGAEGAALATVLTFVIFAAAHLVASVRVQRGLGPLWRGATAGGVGLAFLAAEWWMERGGQVGVLPRGALVAMYAVAVLVMRLVRPTELASLWRHRPHDLGEDGREAAERGGTQ